MPVHAVQVRKPDMHYWILDLSAGNLASLLLDPIVPSYFGDENLLPLEHRAERLCTSE